MKGSHAPLAGLLLMLLALVAPPAIVLLLRTHAEAPQTAGVPAAPATGGAASLGDPVPAPRSAEDGSNPVGRGPHTRKPEGGGEQASRPSALERTQRGGRGGAVGAPSSPAVADHPPLPPLITAQDFEGGAIDHGWIAVPPIVQRVRQCYDCGPGWHGCGEPGVGSTICTPWPKPSAAEWRAGWHTMPPSWRVPSLPARWERDARAGRISLVICTLGDRPSPPMPRCADEPGLRHLALAGVESVALSTWCDRLRSLPTPPPAGAPAPPLQAWAGVCPVAHRSVLLLPPRQALAAGDLFQLAEPPARAALLEEVA